MSEQLLDKKLNLTWKVFFFHETFKPRLSPNNKLEPREQVVTYEWQMIPVNLNL